MLKLKNNFRTGLNKSMPSNRVSVKFNNMWRNEFTGNKSFFQEWIEVKKNFWSDLFLISNRKYVFYNILPDFIPLPKIKKTSDYPNNPGWGQIREFKIQNPKSKIQYQIQMQIQMQIQNLVKPYDHLNCVIQIKIQIQLQNHTPKARDL